MILISFNDRFDATGPRWRQAALAFAASLPSSEGAASQVHQLTSIAALGEQMRRFRVTGCEISEWHIFAPAGIYGFYLGARSYPEQMGEADWRLLAPPFTSDARVYLHGPYGARWMAPLITELFGVQCFGFSDAPEPGTPLPVPARNVQADSTYNSVADLYDAAFDDITVRTRELGFVLSCLQGLTNGMRRPPHILDIGCGNGQMLINMLSKRAITSGEGLDASESMIWHARRRAEPHPSIGFQVSEGLRFPYLEGVFDAAVSFMSFRYLDWNLVLPEILRVVRPGGRFILVDMARSELKAWERPSYWVTKLRTLSLHRQHPRYFSDLKRLVSDRRWKDMLDYHPMRLTTEYEYFLRSRLPYGHWRWLYTCYDHKLFGFVAELTAGTKQGRTKYDQG
jgi:SAM-dependent methyltransferase